MKKTVVLLIAAILLLSSCGAGKTLPDTLSARTIVDAAIKTQESYPDEDDIFDKAQDTFDSKEISLYIDGEYKDLDEYDLIVDGAMCIASGSMNTFEVDILKAANPDDAKKLLSVLQRRYKSLASGDKAFYDPDFQKIYDSAQLYVDGNYAVFIMVPDVSAAKKAIEDLKG